MKSNRVIKISFFNNFKLFLISKFDCLIKRYKDDKMLKLFKKGTDKIDVEFNLLDIINTVRYFKNYYEWKKESINV